MAVDPLPLGMPVPEGKCPQCCTADLVCGREICQACAALHLIRAREAAAARGECGRPGRLYAKTPADAAALDAVLEGWAHKRGLKSLWSVSMVPRCADHRGAMALAVLFPAAWPCDHIEAG